MTNVPDDRRYSRAHEWVLVEDGAALLGITDYAQDQLGDVVFVELPPVGTRVNQYGKIGEVESVKSVSDIYSPVTGDVVEINSELDANPQFVNESPYSQGWMVKVVLNNPEEMETLMSATEYQNFLGTLDH
jgi:glycine cleavage system H protein